MGKAVVENERLYESCLGPGCTVSTRVAVVAVAALVAAGGRPIKVRQGGEGVILTRDPLSCTMYELLTLPFAWAQSANSRHEMASMLITKRGNNRRDT